MDKQPVEDFTTRLLNDLRNAAGTLGMMAGNDGWCLLRHRFLNRQHISH